MANNAPNPPSAPRQRKYSKNADRRSCDGKTKMCYRYVNHTKSGPMTIWADARWKGDLDKEITQLKAAAARIDRKGGLAWAAMYDCRDGRFGNMIMEYTDTTHEWRVPAN